MSDTRPALAIAHVTAKTFDIQKTTNFYCALGLRKVWMNERMSILELRGGTHILFFKQSKKFKKPPVADFDFMVDDIQEFHTSLKKSKLPASRLRNDKLSGHQMFETKDPDGRVISVFSSHTDGRPV